MADVGSALPVYRGAWTDQPYLRGDLVLRSGALYQAINNTASQPGGTADISGKGNPASWVNVTALVLDFTGSDDPTTGAGIPAAISSTYHMAGSGLYVKSDTAATDWTGASGGETFNGGTITDPLVIRAATALDGDVFHVTFGSDIGSGLWVQQVVDGDPLAVTATNLTVRALGVAQSGSIAVYGTETETDFPGVSLGGNGYIRTFTQTDVSAISAFDAPGNVLRFAILPAGQIMTAVVAAPTDGDLSASQVAFWFDDTDGAAKLKIKGKSANGTVVTGTVNLT